MNTIINLWPIPWQFVVIQRCQVIGKPTSQWQTRLEQGETYYNDAKHQNNDNTSNTTCSECIVPVTHIQRESDSIKDREQYSNTIYRL